MLICTMNSSDQCQVNWPMWWNAVALIGRTIDKVVILSLNPQLTEWVFALDRGKMRGIGVVLYSPWGLELPSSCHREVMTTEWHRWELFVEWCTQHKHKLTVIVTHRYLIKPNLPMFSISLDMSAYHYYSNALTKKFNVLGKALV